MNDKAGLRPLVHYFFFPITPSDPRYRGAEGIFYWCSNLTYPFLLVTTTVPLPIYTGAADVINIYQSRSDNCFVSRRGTRRCR
jgi:hypothetical protein